MKTTLFLLLCANMAWAQSDIAKFPFDTVGFPKVFIENVEFSTYYAFVYLPDIYETPDGKRYEVFTKKKKRRDGFSSTYETIKEWYHYPPRLERKPNIVLPKGEKLIDPVYKTITQQREVVPASSRWLTRNGDSSTLHYNVDFAHVFVLVEVLAQYQTLITKYEELQPARKVVGKDTITLDSATLFHYYWEVHEKKQVTFKKKISDELANFLPYTDTFYCKTTLPKDALLIIKGKPSKWQKIYRPPHNACCAIMEIQQVLADKGYYKGELDNVAGKKTKAATIQFQKDNNLPVGSFDVKTLKALDIPFIKKYPFGVLERWE